MELQADILFCSSIKQLCMFRHGNMSNCFVALNGGYVVTLQGVEWLKRRSLRSSLENQKGTIDIYIIKRVSVVYLFLCCCIAVVDFELL